MLWAHASMLADAPRMERQTPVTSGLRSAAFRVQVDSPGLEQWRHKVHMGGRDWGEGAVAGPPPARANEFRRR